MENSERQRGKGREAPGMAVEARKAAYPCHKALGSQEMADLADMFYLRHIEEMAKNTDGKWMYCPSCESFCDTSEPLFRFQFHPKDDLVPLHFFLMKNNITSGESLLWWMEEDLVRVGRDSKTWVRLPGMNRYHFAYRKVGQGDLIDILAASERKEAFLGLDAMVAWKEKEIERLREEAWKLMQELGELREESGSELNRHAGEKEDIFF